MEGGGHIYQSIALTTCIYHQLLLMSLDDVRLKHKDYPTNMYD